MNDQATMQAMTEYGGGFVRALGQAALKADDENLRLIKITWPGYWERYTEMAMHSKVKEDTDA